MRTEGSVEIDRPIDDVFRLTNDHVAEFTREIPRPKVLSARAVMVPVEDGVAHAGRIPAETKIEALAARVIDGDAAFAVTDGEGRVIGQIDRAAVLDVLVSRPEEG